MIKNSEFDNNEDGFDTNSQNGDNPPPQNGACPHNAISPITHTHSCWVFMHNYVHDNNNPNVPARGSAAAGPGRHRHVDLRRAQRHGHATTGSSNNNAWGMILVPFPDSGPPCTGGTLNSPMLGQGSCLFDEWGDAIINNKFTHNGGYGNPTNGDFDAAELRAASRATASAGNTERRAACRPVGGTAADATRPAPTSAVAPNLNVPFLNEVLCDSQVQLPAARLPARATTTRGARGSIMHPLPQAPEVDAESVRRACRATRGARRRKDRDSDAARA